jgi:3-oxoacyl-[acyl-carrier-protein] synthase II
MERPQIPLLPLSALRRSPLPAAEVTPARRRVVVTGLGVVAPTGVGAEPLWEALVAGRSAVRAVDGHLAAHGVRFAAPVVGFQPRDFMPAAKVRLRGRLCQLITAATRLAVADARVPAACLASSRAGVFVGSSAGPVETWERQHARFRRRGRASLRPTFPIAISPNFPAAESASDFGITGPIQTVASDCPSGLDALSIACRLIRAGEIDVALAGGGDAPLTPMLLAAGTCSGFFADDNRSPEQVSRPFDRDRTGFVIGEGAAMLVLQSLEHALATGAHVYGEVLGIGAGRDGAEYVGVSDPTGRGYTAATDAVLADAGCEAEAIDVVSAHASGIPSTDLAEARGLSAALGTHVGRVAVTSIKGVVGHPLAAAGALQVASSLLALERGQLPPTANCDALDPACELDVVRGGPRRIAGSTALVLSHGFAGNSTALLLASHPAARQ